jgi:hypothetical protein
MAAHRVDSRAIATRGRSADVREGIASFFDRRDPVFTDRVSDGFDAIFEEWDNPSFDS